MYVSCQFEEIELAGDYADDVPSVRATCKRCQHTTESYGTHSASRRRCLVVMREECPAGESNIYIDEDC